MSLRIRLGKKPALRQRRKSLGQGDRGGGRPAVHAAEGNAGPAGFSSGRRLSPITDRGYNGRLSPITDRGYTEPRLSLPQRRIRAVKMWKA